MRPQTSSVVFAQMRSISSGFSLSSMRASQAHFTRLLFMGLIASLSSMSVVMMAAAATAARSAMTIAAEQEEVGGEAPPAK